MTTHTFEFKTTKEESDRIKEAIEKFNGRVIPAWLKERITNQIGAMDVFSEEYSGGYDEALEWVLSLEDE